MTSKSRILVSVTVLLTVIFGTNSVRPRGESQQILDRFLEREVRQFKVEYHRILETERIRRKRDAGIMLSMSIQDHPTKVRKISPATEVEMRTPLSDLRVSYWTWVQPDPGYQLILLLLLTDDGQFVLAAYNGQDFTIIQNLQIEDKTYKAQAFVSGPYIWFVLVHQSRQYGHHYVQMYRYDGAEILLKQTILLDTEADVAMVYNRGFWYMATATRDKLTLFEWRQTQFDLVASAPVLGLQSVALWRSAGVVFIATAVSSGRSGSPLFSYTRRYGGKFSRLQVLPVQSARKVVSFKVDGNDYLLYVCQEFVVLYWWAGNMFLEYQVLENTGGAVDAAVLILPNQEAAIALIFKNEIRFYVEGYSSEYYLSFLHPLHVELSHGFGFFFSANLYYFLFLTFDLTNWDARQRRTDETLPENIWKLNVTNYFDLQREEDPLSSCISSMKKNLEENNQKLSYVESNLDRVLVTNKEQDINFPVVVMGEVQVAEGLNVEHIILIPSDGISLVPQITNSVLRDDILFQEQVLNNLSPDMSNLLYKSQNQIINGDLIFMSPFKANKLQLTSLVNDVILNEVPLSDLAEKALRTHGEQTLLHQLHVMNLECQNVFLDGTLNGINTQDLLLLHQDETIQSELHFTNIKVQDINLRDDGRVNGILPSVFVIRDQAQEIQGVKTFHNLVVQKDIIVHGETNQRDLSVFVQNIVRFDEPNLSDWKDVEFSTPLIVEGDVYVEGLINGIVNLQDLASRALDLTSEQLVTGTKTMMGPVFVNGDVAVDGKTNGVDVSEEVLTLSTDQFISGTTVLDSFEVRGDLSTGTVNGYDLRKEVVTIQGPPQAILGHKTFKNSVQVMLNVDMRNGSTLNGLDLSDLVQAATRTDNVVLMGATTFHSLVIQEVIASDSINGISLDHLFNNVWRKSTDQDIDVPVQFHQSVSIDNNLEITNNINGYDLTEDFVHVVGDEQISGYVRFIEDVHVRNGLHVDPGKTINGFDVSDYHRSMVPSQHSTVIQNQVVFSSLEVRGNLIINGTVDGTVLDHFLQADKHQEFTGHVTLSDRVQVSGDLVLDSLFLERDINGVDFSEFNRHVVYDFDTSHDQLPIVEKKDFVGGLEVGKLHSRGTVDGIDLDNWYLKAVRLSSADEISGFKRFSEAVLLGGFRSETLNDVPLSEHLSSVVLRTTDHIRGPKTIQSSVTVLGDLKTKGTVNGVDLQLLESEAAFADADNEFSGRVVVVGNLEVESLELGGQTSLDGLLWNQLVFLDQNHALPGVNTFHDVFTTVDATVRHSVNGCNIRRLAEEAVYVGQPFPALNEPLTVRSLVVHGNSNISGNIGGVNLKSLAEGVLLRNGRQRLTNSIHFQDLHAQNVRLNFISGLNLPALMKDAVLKSQAQTISGVKNFVHAEGVTVFNDITILGDVEVDGAVCGVDLLELQKEAILQTNEQKIEGLKTFTEVEVRGDIYIQGAVNGVSVPSEVILLNVEEEINVPLTLEGDCRVVGQLYVGRHLDGILFQQFVHNRVTLLHDQQIAASIEFQDTLETDSINVEGSVNGVAMTDIVFRHSKEYKLEQKIFENSITIQDNLEVHQLNGVDLLEFNRELVRVNQPQEISALIEFMTDLEVENDLVIEDTINDIDVKGLEEEFGNYHRSLKAQLQSLHEQITMLDILLQSSQQQLRQGEFWELLHFQPFQSLDNVLDKLFSSPLLQAINLDEDTVEGNVEKLLGWSSLCDHGGCCGSSTTQVFGVGTSGYLIVENVEPGRLFPLFTGLPLAENNLHGFVLWTNTTPHTPMCGINQPQAMSIISVENSNGLVNVLQHIRPVFSSTVQDARLFKTRGDLNLLITYTYNMFAGNATSSAVFRYNKDSSSWFLLQPLGGAGGSTSMDLVMYTDRNGKRHLLAALTDRTTLYLYKWTDMQQFQLLSSIPMPGVTSSLWVEGRGNLYLLLSMMDRVHVYAYLPEPLGQMYLAWTQGLDLPGATVLTTFQFSGESFVVAASLSLQEMVVLQWKGADSFVPIQRHLVKGIRDVISYWSSNGNLFLAVAADCGTLVLKAVATGFGRRH